MRALIDRQYVRTPGEITRGQFRVRGNQIEVFPSNQDVIYRLEVSDQEITAITLIDPLTRNIRETATTVMIFPTTHFVTSEPERKVAIESIKKELKDQLKFLKDNNQLLEAERLERRTRYDLAMMKEIGYCNGIENYSRHFDERPVRESR